MAVGLPDGSDPLRCRAHAVRRHADARRTGRGADEHVGRLGHRGHPGGRVGAVLAAGGRPDGGGSVNVVNLDTIDHTFTSQAVDAAGDPLFDVRIPSGSTVTVPATALLADGSYGFFCSFHPHMRGTLVVSGSDGTVDPQLPAFEQPLVVPPVVRGERIRLEMREAGVRVLPRGRRTRMWTYEGSWPGPTITRPAGKDTWVTFANQLPKAAGATTVHLHGDHHAAQGRRAADHVPRAARRRADLPLSADLRRRPRAVVVLLLPRPPDGSHRAQQLARPAGDVHRHRPRREGSPAPPRVARHPAAGQRPVVPVAEPSHRPVRRRADDDRPPRADGLDRAQGSPQRRHRGHARAGQRPLRAVPRRRCDPLPAAAPQRLTVLGLQLLALRRSALRPGRHRQRLPARAGGAQHDHARPGPARRRHRRLPRRDRPGCRAVVRAARRRLGSRGPGHRHAGGRADAVPRRRPGRRPLAAAGEAALAPTGTGPEEGLADLDLRPRRATRATAPSGRSTAAPSTPTGSTTAPGSARSSGGGCATPAT